MGPGGRNFIDGYLKRIFNLSYAGIKQAGFVAGWICNRLTLYFYDRIYQRTFPLSAFLTP